MHGTFRVADTENYRVVDMSVVPIMLSEYFLHALKSAIRQQP